MAPLANETPMERIPATSKADRLGALVVGRTVAEFERRITRQSIGRETWAIQLSHVADVEATHAQMVLTIEAIRARYERDGFSAEGRQLLAAAMEDLQSIDVRLNRAGTAR